MFRRPARSESQTDGATKLNEHSPNKFRYVSDFSKASRVRIGGCVMFDKCTEKLKGNRGM